MSGIFSNASEFMVFNEEYCCTCKKYVPYEQATDDNPVCPIEDKVAMSMVDPDDFPHEHVKRDKPGESSYCIEWEDGVTKCQE